MRLLDLTVSASSRGHNASSVTAMLRARSQLEHPYGWMHSKKRNCLSVTRADELVRSYYNLHLATNHDRSITAPSDSDPRLGREDGVRRARARAFFSAAPEPT